MTQDILTETGEAVRTITIDRPRSRNGLTPLTCVELAIAIEDAGTDDGVRAIVVTGAGTSFCSGADLMESMQHLAGRRHDQVIRESFHRIIRAITGAPKPVIASIRGAAVGFGFDMALACDFRVVSRVSKLGAVFTRIGLVPDGGSSFTLARLVGLTRAMELVMLAETFDGEKAHELGLVTRLVDDEQLETTTQALARRLAAGPPLAFRLLKRNMLEGLQSTLEEALERELEAQTRCLASRDAMEGIAAFLQKRPAEFKGE